MRDDFGRKEIKFLVNAQQYSVIRELLCQYLCTPQGDSSPRIYPVYSLYFDDSKLSCFRDTRDGMPERTKYRMRFYNLTAQEAFVEVKRKSHNFVYKNRERIRTSSSEFLNALTEGKSFVNHLERGGENVANFIFQYHVNRLRPVIWIQYEREAFQLSLPSPVRVTIDSNLSAYQYRSNDNQCSRPYELIDHPLTGLRVLEVKYSTILPFWLRDLMWGLRSTKTSFSKYTFCVQQELERKRDFFVSANPWGT